MTMCRDFFGNYLKVKLPWDKLHGPNGNLYVSSLISVAVKKKKLSSFTSPCHHGLCSTTT